MHGSVCRSSIGIFAAALALGCGGPELGDIVEAEVSLTLTAVASQPELAAVRASQGGLSVTRAFVSASSLTLVPCAREAAELGLPARGYDLASEPPPSERVTTAVTELCRVRLELDPVTAAKATGVPDGATLYVEAETSDGAAVTLSSQKSLSLMLEPEGDATFGEQPLLLGFDVSTWLMGLPLSAGAPAEETAVRLENQLYDAVALYVDQNANQALDDDEATPIARAAAPR